MMWIFLLIVSRGYSDFMEHNLLFVFYIGLLHTMLFAVLLT